MEAIGSPNQFDILEVEIIVLIVQVPTVESLVREVFSKYDFRNVSGLLQYWACTPSNAEDIGCNLLLTGQPFEISLDHEGSLQDYRRRCVENHYPFIGLETNVGNWLAGRAAQTRIADHKTKHHVVNQADQHSTDVGSMGQLVLPVFYDHSAGNNKLVGVIELATLVPKESYFDDFDQIYNLLKEEGLISSYMGKTIKVKYEEDLIKFTLPLSAKFTDMQREMKKRFSELERQIFRVEYYDTEGNRLPISSDEELEVCMADASSKGAKLIRMCVPWNT